MINDVTLYYGNEKAVSNISGGEVVFQLPADQVYNTTLRVELAQGGIQYVSIFSKLSHNMCPPPPPVHQYLAV